MITVYKDKRDIPDNVEYVELNDLFFNQNTAAKLDGQAEALIKKIDSSKLVSKYKIESKFNGVVLDVDCLSTGCKTVLNVLYSPDKVFCMKECGENALEELYRLGRGAVYSDYAMIPFEMENVTASSANGDRVVDDYEELKEWWEDEK